MAPSISSLRVLRQEHGLVERYLRVARTASELEKPGVLERARGPLRHLIVDEYQDVNPAQEELVRRLAGDPVQLCVVGDDQQSIYQWRGSDVGNIIGFEQRQRQRGRTISVARLTDNRRSRPAIVKAANTFAASIPARLEKEMLPTREDATPAIVPWAAETEFAPGMTQS